MKRVGVLALQGDFEAHGQALARAGTEPVYVRTSGDLDRIDGLVIPGGESTTMLKLINAESMRDALLRFDRPVFGTCAGAILLASDVSNPVQESLGLIDIGVIRNGYGRQLESRVAQLKPELDFEARTEPGPLEAVFIRAPIIRRVGEGARVLASYHNDPVLVEQGPHLVATFHPELTQDLRVHRLFVSKL